MTLRFDVGFDVFAFGALKMTNGITDIDLTTGLFCHLDLGSVIPGAYSDFATAVTSGLLGSGTTTTVTYSTTTARYTVNVGASPITLTFGVDESDAAHVRMGQVLGFSTAPGSLSPGAQVEGDIAPFFMIDAAMGGASDATDDYEGGMSEDAEAEDGTSYSVAPTSAPVKSDFTVPFEPRAAVYIRSAVAATPWTWQHFYQHCRAVHPFAVTDDFTDVTVHKLMAKSDRFKPKRVVRDYRELHDLVLKTRVVGRL